MNKIFLLLFCMLLPFAGLSKEKKASQRATSLYNEIKAETDRFKKIMRKGEMFNTGAAGRSETKLTIKDLYGIYDKYFQLLELDSLAQAQEKKGKYREEVLNDMVFYFPFIYNDAVNTYNEKRYEAAEGLLGKVMKIYFDHRLHRKFLKKDLGFEEIDLHMMQGQIYRNLQRHAEALQEFKEVMALSHKKEENNYLLAMEEAKKAKLNDDFNNICREAHYTFGEENSYYCGVLIENCMKANDAEQAVKYAEKAIKRFPENADYYYFLGVVQETYPKHGDPVKSYRQAIDLNPEHAKALFGYGHLLKERMAKAYDSLPEDEDAAKQVYDEMIYPQFLNAIDALEKYIRHEPDDKLALQDLKLLYFLSKDDNNFNRINKLLQK